MDLEQGAERMRSVTLFTSCILAFSGCNLSSDAERGTASVGENSESPVVSTPPAEAPDAEIPLQIASYADVQQWVANQRGKVTVIDVWSTSCLTCMKEFPHFVEMHRESAAEVACASLSVDFYGGEGNEPEDVRPQVESFLKSQQATMQNFICSDTDTAVLEEIKTAAIPAALVFDQQGNLHKIFNNDGDEFGAEGFNYNDHIRPLVERLLEGKSSPSS